MRGKIGSAIILALALLFSFPALAGDGNEQLDGDSGGKIVWKKMGMFKGLGDPGEPDDFHSDTGSVVFDEGMYKLWYSGFDGSHWRIMYATSPDGFVWTKHGVVVDLGPSPFYDNRHVMYPSVLKNDMGTYEMWYVGQGSLSWGWKILYATSNDGINWQKHGLVFSKTGKAVAHPNVLIDEKGVYRMWYSEYDEVHWRIGHATSNDGMTWTDQGVVLDIGSPGDPDSHYVYYPAVMIEPDGTYIMFYCPFDGNPNNILDIHYATSPDGMGASWTKEGLTIKHGEEGDYDEVQAYLPSTIRMRPDDLHELWYTGYDGYHRRMMLALEIRQEIEATMDCDPDTLNLRSKGNWMTCYIELHPGYDPRDIDATTILLNDVLSPELDPKYGFVKSEESYIMDYDGDGIEERMVKFDRSEVQKLVDVGNAVILSVTGEMVDGTRFEGSDTIRVINPPRMFPLELKANGSPFTGRISCHV